MWPGEEATQNQGLKITAWRTTGDGVNVKMEKESTIIINYKIAIQEPLPAKNKNKKEKKKGESI